MHMRVVCSVVKRSIPLQVTDIDFLSLSQLGDVSPHQFPLRISLVIPQPLGILAVQTDDVRPYDTLGDFDTRDEVFCGLQNLHNVPCKPIAWAYSDPTVISRHGQPGTGKNEVVAAVGRYGRGRTVTVAYGKQLEIWIYPAVSQ